MKVKSLVIKPNESWHSEAGKLVAAVVVECGMSTMTIQLTSNAIRNIFEVVREEASLQIKKDASQVGNVFKETISGVMELGQSYTAVEPPADIPF